MARYKSTSSSSKNRRLLRSLPPKKLENLEKIWLKGGRNKSKEEASVWSNIKLFRHSRSPIKTKMLILTSAVVVLGLIFYFFLGSAQVLLKPQKEVLDQPVNISVSSEYDQIDVQGNKIPGQLLTSREEVSQDFPATGRKEVAQKARGKITVFNNFGAEPQIFVATTRFESAAGLIFRTPRPIVIPGSKLTSGKLVPGSVEVEVIADKPGADYNIGPGKFSVPGLRGSPRFDGFYAQSFEPFSGGITGISSVVTETDLNKAKEKMTKLALEKTVAQLKAKANNLKILEPVASEVVSLQSTAEIEQATEGFAVKAAVQAQTIGFLEKDLLELVRLAISKEQEMILLSDSLRLDYQDVKIDLERNQLSFTLLVKGEAAVKIDQDKIIGQMLGMKQEKIPNYLLGLKELESAKVILSPFWVRTVPKNRQDVKVQLLY